MALTAREEKAKKNTKQRQHSQELTNKITGYTIIAANLTILSYVIIIQERFSQHHCQADFMISRIANATFDIYALLCHHYQFLYYREKPLRLPINAKTYRIDA